jgi:hypothetical protein
MNDAVFRLQDAWRECERNLYHLCRALTLLEPLMPMTGATFDHLTDTQVQSVDQFILRFTKLQDAMGNHLFPSLLYYLQEQYEARPMLDKLNRLEKLSYLRSAEIWQHIRHTRNKFAHDYPDDGDKNAALLNVASEVAKEMYLILMAIEKKLKNEQPALVLGKALSVQAPKRWSLDISQVIN